MMSANKEAVLSEKELRAGFNQRVLVGYSEVIRSGDFPDVPAFVRAVQTEWDRQWRRVYTADWAGACALCGRPCLAGSPAPPTPNFACGALQARQLVHGRRAQPVYQSSRLHTRIQLRLLCCHTLCIKAHRVPGTRSCRRVHKSRTRDPFAEAGVGAQQCQNT